LPSGPLSQTEASGFPNSVLQSVLGDQAGCLTFKVAIYEGLSSWPHDFIKFVQQLRISKVIAIAGHHGTDLILIAFGLLVA
jgi:hypothetical protein